MNPFRQPESPRQRLRRSRAIATGALVIAAIVYVGAVFGLKHGYAWLGYVKAFAEASMVGGLADWFAVTALFRRPLGLPIAHTALLPRNQQRIADELGRFIEHNFLQEKAIAQKVYEFHPGQKILCWLNQPQHAQWIAQEIVKQLPRAAQIVKPEQMADFLSQMMQHQYDGAAIGRTLSRVIALMHVRGATNLMLTTVLRQVQRWLNHDKTRRMLEEHINRWANKSHKDNPGSWDKILSSLKLSAVDMVDGWVAKKALNWADEYCADVLNNKGHPVRAVFEKKIRQMVFLLHYSGRCHRKLEAMKTEWAEAAAVRQTLQSLWENVQNWVALDAHKPDSMLSQHLEALLQRAFNEGAHHPEVLKRLDARLALWVRTGVRQYKHRAAEFIADKVKSWNSEELVDKIELSVGRDLQYIRLNGTLVGGLVGLLIYALSQWL